MCYGTPAYSVPWGYEEEVVRGMGREERKRREEKLREGAEGYIPPGTRTFSKFPGALHLPYRRQCHMAPTWTAHYKLPGLYGHQHLVDIHASRRIPFSAAPYTLTAQLRNQDLPYIPHFKSEQ